MRCVACILWFILATNSGASIHQLELKWKQDNRFIYNHVIITINQLVLWDPPVNYYSISRQRGSTFTPKHSASWHQLAAVWNSLSPVAKSSAAITMLSRHIWKLNCSLLHMTRSNISDAGASDSNCRYTAPPINVFDTAIDDWHCLLHNGLLCDPIMASISRDIRYLWDGVSLRALLFST